MGYRVGEPSHYVLDTTFAFEPVAQGKYFNTRYTVDAVITDTLNGTEQFIYHAEGHVAGNLQYSPF